MRKRPPTLRQEDNWNNLCLEQWSQPEMSLLLRAALFGKVWRHFGDHTGEGVASGLWETEARDAAKHPTMCGAAPTTAIWSKMSKVLRLEPSFEPVRSPTPGLSFRPTISFPPSLV